MKIKNLNRHRIKQLLAAITRINDLTIILHQYCKSQSEISELRTLTSLTRLIFEDADLINAEFINCEIVDDNGIEFIQWVAYKRI